MRDLQLFSVMRIAVEESLKVEISKIPEGNLRNMLSYHMGWVGEGSGENAQGKRIRPLITLLTCAATGGVWQDAIPAATAIEMVHNFSLIHDDIEDNSEFRRGRKTVWTRWGIPQAINAGDLLFSLARTSMFDLNKTLSPDRILYAAVTLDKTCNSLTYGQFLDLDYEQKNTIGIDDYWKMISGKTAALTACSARMGGIVSGAEPEIEFHLAKFGQHLGLAFQIVDDWLGIWGEAAITGKSAESDLVSGKKSLPVIFGLVNSKDFAEQWKSGINNPQMASGLSDKLIACGAQIYTEEKADLHTKLALDSLKNAIKDEYYLQVLTELTNELLIRKR